MTVLFVAALVTGLLIAVLNWRRGLLVCIAAGFLQDPMRKIWPGQPVAFVVLVAVFFVVCLVSAMLAGERPSIARLFRWFPGLRLPSVLFAVIVLVQTGVTVVRSGNLIIAGIGVLSYFSPIAAVLLGERFAEDRAHLLLWLRAYLLGSVVVAATILAQFLGVQSRFFISIGLDIVYGVGGVVEMLPGMMRSSEIAAWHVAAATCLIFAATLAAKRPRSQAIGAGVLLGLIAAIFLTGRRKMLAELILFGLVFTYFATHLRKTGSRLLRLVAAGAVVVFVLTQILFAEGTQIRIAPYLGRGISVVQDSGNRLVGMTLDQFQFVVGANGFFGSGAGTGAQGTQYFGGGEEIVGGAAEGGMGRVLAELGVPGLFVAIWLAIALWSALWKIARAAQQLPSEIAVLTHGMIAFLPANAAVFLTAHQVFGDPFVLIVLGWITGSVLAIPRIVLEAEAQARAQAARSAGAGAALSAAAVGAA